MINAADLNSYKSYLDSQALFFSIPENKVSAVKQKMERIAQEKNLQDLINYYLRIVKCWAMAHVNSVVSTRNVHNIGTQGV